MPVGIQGIRAMAKPSIEQPSGTDNENNEIPNNTEDIIEFESFINNIQN